MSFVYRFLFPAMWLSWMAYWWLASRGAKPVARREPLGSRLLHVLPLALAVWLLWSHRVRALFSPNGCSRGRHGSFGQVHWLRPPE